MPPPLIYLLIFSSLLLSPRPRHRYHEFSSIIISRLAYMVMRPHRFVFNLGYTNIAASGTVGVTSVAMLLSATFLELAFEFVVDNVALQVESGHVSPCSGLEVMEVERCGAVCPIQCGSQSSPLVLRRKGTHPMMKLLHIQQEIRLSTFWKMWRRNPCKFHLCLYGQPAFTQLT